jgi:hypothetical protein
VTQITNARKSNMLAMQQTVMANQAVLEDLADDREMNREK